MRISHWSSDVCSSDLCRTRAICGVHTSRSSGAREATVRRAVDQRRSRAERRSRTMTLAFETVDVFTDTAFGGNPLAVVFGADGLPTDTLQRIAREFNYSETTFVLPPADQIGRAHV